MRRALAILALAAAAGCGPITYVSQVTVRAQSAVDAARDAGGEHYAPYFYTRAVQYLELARLDAARADWQGANRWGHLSQEAGDQAVIEAALAKKDPSRLGPIAPADDDKPLKPAKPAAPAPAPAKAAP